MRHLDMAGGTGDVAFRVLREMREDQIRQQKESDSPSLVQLGQVHVCDINPDMLQEGQRKAQQQQLGTFTWYFTPVCKRSGLLISLGHLKHLLYLPLGCLQDIALMSGTKLWCSGEEGSLAWVVGDAEQLPFQDGSMDAYTIAFGIRNVTNIDAALAEAFRVCSISPAQCKVLSA